jgi:hypothetical protein
MELIEALARKIERDVEHAQNFFQITPLYNNQGMITRLQLEMIGALGAGNPARMRYSILITLDGYPFVCPRAWVEKPGDSFIYHMQIWQPRPPLNLPEVCTSAESQYQKDWAARRIAPGERNIAGFLRQILFTLNNENSHSKARI